MNNQEEKRNSKNCFELEGNVSYISDIYVNKNNKKMLKFDLGQNNNGYSQFIPITIKGKMVDSFGNAVKKGDWLSIKGRISTYSKVVEKNGNTFKDKAIEILGFEITDRTNNKVYTSDGEVQEISKISKSEDEIER